MRAHILFLLVIFSFDAAAMERCGKQQAPLSDEDNKLLFCARHKPPDGFSVPKEFVEKKIDEKWHVSIDGWLHGFSVEIDKEWYLRPPFLRRQIELLCGFVLKQYPLVKNSDIWSQFSCETAHLQKFFDVEKILANYLNTIEKFRSKRFDGYDDKRKCEKEIAAMLLILNTLRPEISSGELLVIGDKSDVSHEMLDFLWAGDHRNKYALGVRFWQTCANYCVILDQKFPLLEWLQQKIKDGACLRSKLFIEAISSLCYKKNDDGEKSVSDSKNETMPHFLLLDLIMGNVPLGLDKEYQKKVWENLWLVAGDQRGLDCLRYCLIRGLFDLSGKHGLELLEMVKKNQAFGTLAPFLLPAISESSELGGKKVSDFFQDVEDVGIKKVRLLLENAGKVDVSLDRFFIRVSPDKHWNWLLDSFKSKNDSLSLYEWLQSFLLPASEFEMKDSDCSETRKKVLEEKERKDCAIDDGLLVASKFFAEELSRLKSEADIKRMNILAYLLRMKNHKKILEIKALFDLLVFSFSKGYTHEFGGNEALNFQKSPGCFLRYFLSAYQHSVLESKNKYF